MRIVRIVRMCARRCGAVELVQSLKKNYQSSIGAKFKKKLPKYSSSIAGCASNGLFLAHVSLTEALCCADLSSTVLEYLSTLPVLHVA